MPSKKRSKARADISDAYGIRGAGATSQAAFGDPLSVEDLLFAVKREPVAKRAVFNVARDIFSKKFTVEEVSEKPNPNWSKEVGKVLDGLNATKQLTILTIFERLFGWSFLALTYVDEGKDISKPVTNPKEIRELVPYTVLQASVQSTDEDNDPDSPRCGLPVFYSINRKGQGQKKLHFSRTIHCATRTVDHPWQGWPVLENIYDDITVWRNERWGLGQTLFRYGSGFPDVTIKGAKKDDIDELEASKQFENLQARTYFLHGDDKILEFKGVAGAALNPAPYTSPVIESLSCGSDIPSAILRGAQAGALTGSEVNEREYWGYIAQQQTLLEPVIWELIDRLIETGQISEVEDYRIVWPSGIELNEKDKATVDLQLAQARNLKTSWMMIDEIRAEQKLGPLPNDAGKVVLGVKKAEQQPFGQSPEAVSAADVGPFTWISRLRRKKQDANDKSKQS